MDYFLSMPMNSTIQNQRPYRSTPTEIGNKKEFPSLASKKPAGFLDISKPKPMILLSALFLGLYGQFKVPVKRF